MGSPAKTVKKVIKLAPNLVKETAKATGIIEKPKAPAPKVEPKAPVQAAAESITKPSAVTPKAAVASGDSEMAATGAQTRRRRARGIATGARGVTGKARVARKTLLGE